MFLSATFNCYVEALGNENSKIFMRLSWCLCKLYLLSPSLDIIFCAFLWWVIITMCLSQRFLCETDLPLPSCRALGSNFDLAEDSFWQLLYHGGAWPAYWDYDECPPLRYCYIDCIYTFQTFETTSGDCSDTLCAMMK